MHKFAHLRLHSVLALLIVHPVLHAKHFAVPFTGQSAPVSATPFIHVHVFAAK